MHLTPLSRATLSSPHAHLELCFHRLCSRPQSLICATHSKRAPFPPMTSDPHLPAPPGASLVQIYTALAYDGPKAVPSIKTGLAACLERDGFKNVAEAVGADHRAGAAVAKADKKGLMW